MKQVYATWKPYEIITNNRTEREVLITGTGFIFVWMSSPLESEQVRANGYLGQTGDVNVGSGNDGGSVVGMHRARPAKDFLHKKTDDR